MEIPHDPSASRYEHVGRGLRRSDLDPNPIRQFANWFTAAIEAGIRDVNAMSLATADRDARPSVRIVLLKSFDQDGFVFFTNYESTKGKQLEANPYAALGLLLDRTRPANSRQRKSGEDLTRRIASLFSFSSCREPVERMGFAPKRNHRRAACARCAHGGNDRALRRQADSIAAALGRLSTQAG